MGPALVIGGTGFIGRHVVHALTARGVDVRVTLRPERPERRGRGLGGAKIMRASLEDVPSLIRAADGCETIYFAAAHYPRWSLRPAVETEIARAGVRAVEQAALAAGVRRVVVTSSTATIGPPAPGRQLADEGDRWPEPPVDSTYHAVKLAVEDEVARAVDRGLPAIVVCPGGCLGDEDARAGTGFFLVALARKKLPYWIEGTINVVDVAAVGAAHVQAAERGRIGSRYLLGGVNTTVGALLEQAAKVVRVPFEARCLPIRIAALWAIRDEAVAEASGGSRKFFAREFVDMVRFGVAVDSSRAVRELELAPTDLPAALERACLWYEEHRYIPRRDRAQGAASARAAEEDHVV